MNGIDLRATGIADRQAGTHQVCCFRCVNRETEIRGIDEREEYTSEAHIDAHGSIALYFNNKVARYNERRLIGQLYFLDLAIFAVASDLY